MSWFKIPKSFVAHTDAKAEEVNENNDAIEAAFNGLFQAGKVQAADTSFPGLESSEKDIAGSSKSVSVDIPSIALVTMVVDAEMQGNEFQKHFLMVWLNVDGANQAARAELGRRTEATTALAGHEDVVQSNICQTYAVTLGPGVHTLKMRARHDGLIGLPKAQVWGGGTGYTYLIIPNPEP